MIHLFESKRETYNELLEASCTILRLLLKAVASEVVLSVLMRPLPLVTIFPPPVMVVLEPMTSVPCT